MRQQHQVVIINSAFSGAKLLEEEEKNSADVVTISAPEYNEWTLMLHPPEKKLRSNCNIFLTNFSVTSFTKWK